MIRAAHIRARRGNRLLRIEGLEGRSLPSFVAAPSLPVGPDGGVGSKPAAIATGDFNRDGRLDVVTANTGSNGISVLLGTGNGGFKPAINIDIGRAPVGILAVDVNGDGKLDIVTANKDDGTVTVLLGNGLGGFKVAGTIAAGPGPVAVAAGEFNGDGHIDLAVANFGFNTAPGTTVTLLMGTGTGKFNPGGTVPVGNKPSSVVVGDFNGDGKPDIATVSGGFGHLDINLNNGDGTFSAPVNYATGFCANTVVVGDFNHDGKADLAVACNFPSNNGVSVLLGKGDGTFPTFTNYNVSAQSPRTLVAADLNGDGNLDLVTANDQFANNSVSVLLGNPDGTFQPATSYTANQAPVGVAVGDFNGDGWADVVTVGYGKPIGTTGQIGTVATLFGNGDGTLVAPANLVAGNRPGPQVAADFNGDGKPDLAVVSTDVNYNGVLLFPGLGNGSFGPALHAAAVNGPTAVAVGDFNGDGKPDLAVATTNGVSIFLGNGDGTFGAPHVYADANNPVWVAAADFNGDGKADLVLADSKNGCPGVTVLLGNGDGTFGTPTTVAAGGPANNLAVADFNGDGKADLAVVNNQTTSDPGDTLTVLLGQGNGNFVLSKSYPTNHAPNAVAVGDFNGDGKPDLAVTTFFGPGLMIFQNGAGGKFTLKGTYQTDSLPIGVVVADWNGDHKLDIATINEFGDTVTQFNGNGNGTFGKAASYVVGDFPMWGSVADFNGDGRPDLAVSNSNSGSVTLLETPTPATHFLVSTAPGTVTAGKAVQTIVSAVDAAGHLVPGFTGVVSLTSTDGSATLPGKYAFGIRDHGVHKFAVTVRSAGLRNVVAHDGAITGTGSAMVDAAAATHLKVVAPTNPTAGSPFDLTVLALDPFGNPDPGFVGTVHLVTTDPSSGIAVPADYTFTAGDAGSHTFTNGMTLLTAGSRTITATTIGSAIKGLDKVTVVAGALAGFKLSGFPPTTKANAPHAFTVIAQDAYGNTIVNYVGTVQFSNTGGTAVLPASYTFTAANKGKHVFKATLLTPGTGQSLTVTDEANPAITAAETGITVM